MTDYTIGIDTIDAMLNKIQSNPWPIYKVKLGTEHDLEIMKKLTASTNARFRVDANAGWSTDKALRIIPALSEMGIELIEQPLAKNNWEGMQQLMSISTIPLLADESCVSEKDVEQCSGFFHGINIKLTKCSGITPALRMIATARKMNLKVMMGSMNESSIGSAAIAQFLPQLDFVDADGPLLLSRDVAEGLVYHQGKIELSGLPGLGLHHVDIRSFPSKKIISHE